MREAPGSTGRLIGMAVARMLSAVVLLGLLFFLPAGTFHYWQAWVYMAVLLTPMVFMLVFLLRKDPGLLRRRMNMKESRGAQQRFIGVTLIYFLLIYVLPGLDRRFGWSQAHWSVVILADAGILLSYLLFAWVLRTNSFAARVVTVDQEQRVISSGPYALVRHPMYLAVTFLFGLTPLGLGSYWGLIASMLLPVLLAARIRDEEAMLLEELPGYREYTEKVRYRLLPGIW